MHNHQLVATTLIALWLSLMSGGVLRAADEEFGAVDPGGVPKLKPASNAGEEAIAKMRPAPGLKVELYAAEPLLANPVALNFDEKGRCYLVETWRLEHGVIDIRGHMSWLDDDLMCKTVEDRLKMARRKMGPNARTFARYPDVVRLLEDTRGTGKADKSTVFAEFHGMTDGIAAGVVARKGNVYLTNIPNLWLLKDPKGTGHADFQKSLSYGYGIRYNFIGHDLHGPRFGPDGKLYFTIGDRAANVTQTVDGRHVENLDSGCCFRCNPDGSGLEVFATGLRNPQSLAFDDYGNLFTGDNNPDYGDPARWVYIVEAGDSGWRVGYQEDRNPIGGGPWMWEHLWQTQDKSNAAYLLQPIAHLGAGPSGVAYYPGTGLSTAFDKHFFECDFRGGFTGSGVHMFVMQPDGAGFKMADLRNFIWDTLATDIAFGPWGGAYITDWVEGWHVSGVGRIYHIFDPQAMKDPIVDQVKRLLADGFEKRSREELIELLGHRDQRVRQEAQYELADRGAAMIPMLGKLADQNAGPEEATQSQGPAHQRQLARIHAVWALGQIGATSPSALKPVLPLLDDRDPEVRAQAARVLGDHHDQEAFNGFLHLLDDSSLRVRYFAAVGLGKLGRAQAVGPVLQMLRENADRDIYLRHAGVMALTWINDFSAIETAAKDSSRSVRLAALLAMRRLERPEVGQFLHDPDPQLALEAARAIDDVPISAALPQLAALIDGPTLPDYVMIRMVNANYRVGTPEAAAALARFAAKSDAPQRWRVAALKDLADWQSPGHLDRLTNLPRPLPDRDPNVARNAAGPALASILHTAPTPVRVAALQLIQKLGVSDSGLLVQLASDQKLGPEVREGAIQALAARNDPKLAEAVDVAMKDANEQVRCAAIRAMGRLAGSVPRIQSLLGGGTIRQRQGAFEAMGEVGDKSADDVLAGWMDKLLAGQVTPELQLDLLASAGRRQSPRVQQKLLTYEQSLSKHDPLAPYRVALAGGDAASGDKIFHLRADAQCLRCHTVHGSGGIVGPVLDGIGSKYNREYLLESIVFPNAKIAPGFESVILRLKDGRTVTGIVKKETDRMTELMDADGNKITVFKADVVARRGGESAMPEDVGKALSKRDLRDLVEYLASLKG